MPTATPIFVCMQIVQHFVWFFISVYSFCYFGIAVCLFRYRKARFCFEEMTHKILLEEFLEIHFFLSISLSLYSSIIKIKEWNRRKNKQKIQRQTGQSMFAFAIIYSVHKLCSYVRWCARVCAFVWLWDQEF